MYYKVEDKRLISSHDIKTLPDGSSISNFTAWLADKTEAVRVALGWYEKLVVGIPPRQPTHAEYSVVGNEVVQTWIEDPIPEPAPFAISKRSLRLAMRARGMEALLDGLLASSPEIATDWAEAVTLDSDNPIVLGAAAQLVGGGYLTEAEVKVLFEESKSELQV
jgi:hypothetical protein